MFAAQLQMMLDCLLPRTLVKCHRRFENEAGSAGSWQPRKLLLSKKSTTVVRQSVKPSSSLIGSMPGHSKALAGWLETSARREHTLAESSRPGDLSAETLPMYAAYLLLTNDSNSTKDNYFTPSSPGSSKLNHLYEVTRRSKH